MENQKVKVYNESNLPTADYGSFEELQEDFKIMDLDRLMLLKRAIVERGFKYSFKAWKDEEGKLWIIDAHRRKQALKILESDGFYIPPIPYELIHAETRKEAIEEIAFVNSQYSDINPDTELFKKYNIELDSLPISIKELKINFGNGSSGSGETKEEKKEIPGIPREAITKFGDIYTLNEHMVQCGDSEDSKMVKKLIADRHPIIMVTDPPYGVKYDPAWMEKALDSWKKPRSTGKVLNDNKISWVDAYKLFPGEIAYIWHAGKYGYIVAEDMIKCEFDIISQIIWAKQHFVISRGDYHWQHEPCWYGVKKGSKHNWQGARDQSTVWDIKNNSAMGNANKEEVYGHGTQKPLECMARPIRNNTESGQMVYDPFLGSGTTLIACQELNRICIGQELLPNYVDVIIERWINFMRDNDLYFKIWRNNKELSPEEIELFLVTRDRISLDEIIKKEEEDAVTE
jgi:DNA modification methylase